ncbi:MAG: enoyl-CoA hydratase [Alphaproteobacteria bacterium]|nr:MAG: enoyl-CoA hydratase [Alphaproteobacteria bacterium]
MSDQPRSDPIPEGESRDGPLLRRRAGAVLELILDRPEALNALNLALEAALRRGIRAAGADAGLRAIVLTGAGRAFSVGVDLKELEADPAGLSGRHWHGPESLAEMIRALPQPVIAAVGGPAVTGGLELALAADFLIASTEARFADTHALVGITPSWGLSQILPRLIGQNRARQMSLTGMFIDAARAEAWGLVNEVHPPEALLPRARELAAAIAETEPVTMGRVRRLIALAAETGLSAGLAAERVVFDAHIPSVTPAAIAERRARVIARGRAQAGRGRSGSGEGGR